jgi:uncharacterized membrane protein required for colicin V production
VRAAAAFRAFPGSPITIDVLVDLLALIVLAVFVVVGARRGALASGLSLVALLGSYAAAILAASRLGPLAAESLGVAPPLGMIAAGTAGLVAAALLFSIVSFALRRAEASRRGDGARGALDHTFGALFGAGRGALLVLLLGVLALWLDAARMMGEPASMPAPEPTPLRVVAGAAVEAGVASALGGSDAPGAAVAARIAARPAEALGSLRRVIEHPHVVALIEDQDFFADVEEGSVDFALARPSFRRLSADVELRHELAAAGVIDEASARDPSLFRMQARSVLAELGPRLRALRDDPDLRRLSSDPEVSALLQRGDVVGLLFHPGFQRVVSRALGAAPTG